MYNKRKFGQLYAVDLKRLSKELLVVKKKAQETFLCPVLQNEGKCWTEFYKCVKRRKGNTENILAVKARKGKHITDTTEKANSYYASLFSRERNIPHIQLIESGKSFTISINIIRKRLSAVGRKKSVGPDGIPGEVLNVGREAMIPYLVRLLDITMNNNAITADWIKAIEMQM